MKKDQKIKYEFNKISKQYQDIKQQVAKTKSGKLWHQEAQIRNKIKSLQALPSTGLKGYKQVYDNYVGLLETVSIRLLEFYNKNNKTSYRFEEIVSKNQKAYLSSGIMSVLLTDHIPRIVAEEYKRLLPANPKDEFPHAREMKRSFFLHLGETNTGKTYNALQRLKASGQGIYLSPLRILALENFERLNSEGVACNLLTGEEEIIVEGANHSSCTVEKLDISKKYEVAVIDEVQLLGDAQRGDAWTRAILGMCCPEIHLCGALTAKDQLIKMISDCGDSIEIKEYSRLVPLQIQGPRVKLTDVKPGDALVAFSRRAVLSFSKYYTDRGVTNSVIYGDLPPEVRKVQYDLFTEGKSQILISTDAIGMGVNLPIKRIIFTETRKFDGEEFRLLTSQEIKQIAGRAGRIGIYDIGYVACMEDDIFYVEDQLQVKDEAIYSAVVGPSEVILRINGLP